MIGSLWTGISGLAGQQTALDNEAHNIANVNTIGYKASRISFADQVYQNKIGKGVQVLDAEKTYKQGNLKLTGVSYDMALSGDGFFSVKNQALENFYTRAGNFRMGDNGTLQDSLGNEVIGWAIKPEQEVMTTNPNLDRFTNEFTKLLSSRIIKQDGKVETITAKATDYNMTAMGDSNIFSGAGLKSKATKLADVDELVKNYNKRLQDYQNDPLAESITSVAQISRIQLPDQNSLNAVGQDGDSVTITIDGKTITQAYITGIGETIEASLQDSYRRTMKAFADKISSVAGLKAFIVTSEPPYNADTKDDTVGMGMIKIKSLIPGKGFNITSLTMIHSGRGEPGGIKTDVEAEEGQGLIALENARDALKEAITGKQMDVYAPSDLMYDGQRDYQYSISIYDKGRGEVVKIDPLSIEDPNDIDDFVDRINGTNFNGNNAGGITDFTEYIRAENINGHLVIKTLNSNYDVEFKANLMATASEEQTIDISGDATGPVEFLGVAVSGSLAGDSAAQTVNRIVADKNNIIEQWNANNQDAEIEDIRGSGSQILIVYKNTEGNVPELSEEESQDIVFSASTQVIQGGKISHSIEKNSSLSGREGANAEMLEMKNTLDQTASKESLQLRLDTLGISNITFGDFSVDDKGLITMEQNGARFAIGQVAIAKFSTNRALDPVGDNLVRATLLSGDPIYSTNNNNVSDIQGKTLELSTADLSESLVNLMVFQRAFEANAKTITTADMILNTLIQLKR